MSINIKILHSSCCATGSPIKDYIEAASKEAGIDVTIQEFSDLQDTMKYGTTTFPSLVINDEVHNFSRLKDHAELVKFLKEIKVNA